MARFKTTLGKPELKPSDLVDPLERFVPETESESEQESSGDQSMEEALQELEAFEQQAKANQQSVDVAQYDVNNSYVKTSERPKAIGRYKIIDELGRGAMAYVYKAYDPEIDRFLAVKVLREELANDEDYKSGFIREAKLAGQLAHPGIVTIYDVGIADGQPYIAMELLDGIPLDELLKKKSRLPLKFVISVLLQLTRALLYAHKQGVVHRDIKPGNIILLSDNKTAKLTDFGIAQLDESLMTQGKRQDKVLGTPEYMAPEQVLGQHVDARSDLYSLGILVYATITGMTPFFADDYGELFRQIIKEKVPSMNVEGVAIPDELQDIVRRLLQKHPEKRYQNATGLLHDIRDMIEVMETSVKQEKRTGFISLKLKWTLSMASMVAITMLIGLVVVYYQQFFAMRNLATDYGYSTARSIASEVAEPLLLNDKVALDAILQDVSKNQRVTYLSIRDKNQFIVASTKNEELDQAFAGFPASELIVQQPAANIYSRQVSDTDQVFDIDTSITFQQKELGRVWISISANELVQSTKTTLMIMIALMIVTLIAVFSIALAFARKISHQMNKFVTAMERVRRGQFNRRVTVDRNDEFGRASEAFNLMSESLEKRWDNRSRTQAPDHSVEDLKVIKPTGEIAETTDESTVILQPTERQNRK